MSRKRLTYHREARFLANPALRCLFLGKVIVLPAERRMNAYFPAAFVLLSCSTATDGHSCGRTQAEERLSDRVGLAEMGIPVQESWTGQRLQGRGQSICPDFSLVFGRTCPVFGDFWPLYFTLCLLHLRKTHFTGYEVNLQHKVTTGLINVPSCADNKATQPLPKHDWRVRRPGFVIDSTANGPAMEWAS